MSNKGKIDLNIKEEYEKLVEETSNKAGDKIPVANTNDKGLPYEGTFSLKDTAKMMVDPDHKVGFVAEYIQLKVRYEKLKHLLNKWEAFDEFENVHIDGIPSYQERLTNWLGFLPFGSYQLLKRQQSEMGELLHILEVRAVLEGIDLTKVVIVL